MPMMPPMTTTLRSMNAAKGGRRRTQHMYRGGYRYSRRYRGGQPAPRPPAHKENPKVTRHYDPNTVYERDDIVFTQDGERAGADGQFYHVLTERNQGKDIMSSPDVFKPIPNYDGNAVYNLDDLIVFGFGGQPTDDPEIYKRVEPTNVPDGYPPQEYAAGADPQTKPYVWERIAIHIKIIRGYDNTTTYKRNDFVAAGDGEFYEVITDSVTEKEPSVSSDEFKLIPRLTTEGSHAEHDRVVFEQVVYSRIQPYEGETPYEGGQNPRDNPYAWKAVAKMAAGRNSRATNGNNSGKSGNNSGKSGNNSGATNVNIARMYNDTREYKHDDIVGGVDGQFYLVLTDSVTGKEPSANPNEFKLIPRMTMDNPSEAGELSVGDVVSFVGSTSAQNYFFYKRVQPDGGQTPYEVGQTPDTNPYAWKAVARMETPNDSPAEGETTSSTADAPAPVASNAPTPVASAPVAGRTARTAASARQIQDFDNFKTYTAGDLIRYKSEVGDTPYEGKIYKMTVPIGAAGYAPMAYPTHFVEMMEGPNGLEEAPTTTMAAEGGRRRRTRRNRNRKTRRRRGTRRH